MDSLVTLMHVDKHSNMIQRFDDSTNQHSEPSLSATAKGRLVAKRVALVFRGHLHRWTLVATFFFGINRVLRSTSRICLTCLILHSKQG